MRLRIDFFFSTWVFFLAESILATKIFLFTAGSQVRWPQVYFSRKSGGRKSILAASLWWPQVNFSRKSGGRKSVLAASP